jgi:hypothetical protein
MINFDNIVIVAAATAAVIVVMDGSGSCGGW